jgi:hypothetical protein
MKPRQFCPYAEILSQGVARLRNIVHTVPFTIVINGTPIETDLFEAVLFSPFVYSQLLSDSSSRKFHISDDSVDSSTFFLLRQLFDGTCFPLSPLSRRSLLSLSRCLGNVELEKLFLCFPMKTGKETFPSFGEIILSSRAIDASEFYAYSIEDVKSVDFETLEEVLDSPSLRVKSEDSLLRLVLDFIDRSEEYVPLLRHIRFEFLSPEGISLFVDQGRYRCLTEDVWNRLSVRLKGLCDESIRSERYYRVDPPELNSKIITGFPSIFAEFEKKEFALLYRGSVDGFGAADFHRKCDGHGNTLTVIQTNAGNIFGGYSPCVWDSSGASKSDETVTSFLFSLNCPYLRDPKRFPLKSDHKHEAIYTRAIYGPAFGWNNARPDLMVYDGCNTRQNYNAGFGTAYQNTTGLDGRTFLDGGANWVVREIEVFEITG